MPGFLGRAESEGWESGHGLMWGGGCLNTLGTEGAWGWVGHLGALQSDGLGRGRGCMQKMFEFQFVFLTLEQMLGG